MASRTDAKQLLKLKNSIASARAILQRFQAALLDSNATPLIAIPADSPHPLSLLADSSSVLKAQTTKLSLLVINQPYTPSEITYILQSVTNLCLPALMTAAELVPEHRYTAFLHKTIRSGVARMMREMLSLLDEIPVDERGVEKTRGRDALASTGVVWEACDAMLRLASTGIVTAVVERVKEYHNLLKDAIEELKEWDGDEGDEDFLDGSSSERSSTRASKAPAKSVDSMAADMDHLSVSGTSGPPSRDIEVMKDNVVQALSLIQLLYPALIKRRIQRFPNISSQTKDEDMPSADQMKNLDQLIGCCQGFTNSADDLAAALYECDEVEVKNGLDTVKEDARKCVELVKANWRGEDDEFSTWIGKWLVKLEEL
ncbi:MAG: hypothetical protein MMC33_004827 [Icmadophila ericetorum]|nr:hypothetical protein [Icmadophila ericetorum]